MLLPKIIVIVIFLLLILVRPRVFFFNKFVFAGLLLFLVLGVIFSDSIYYAVNRKVSTFVQAPGSNNLPFISEKWKSAGLKNPADNTRDRMVPELLMRNRLMGNKKAGIINMLGEPEGTHNFPEWDMEYYLGPSQYGNGTRWLVISFNNKDEVSDYTVNGK